MIPSEKKFDRTGTFIKKLYFFGIRNWKRLNKINIFSVLLGSLKFHEITMNMIAK